MPANTDPYVYPGSRVLRNLADIREQDRFDAFEANATTASLWKLRVWPIKGDFDIAHLKVIHKFVFEDVFKWAGQFRTVDMSKGNSFFARAQFIESSLSELFSKLKAENHLKQLDRETFAVRAGHYLAELNAIHPFREGNGRVQREFIRELGVEAGYKIDWRHVTRGQMTIASRLSLVSGDSTTMGMVVRACIA